jgi:hypothetical protein
MKWNRWILIGAVAALAACSNQTAGPIPQTPDSSGTKKPPPNQGFVMPVTLPAPPVAMTS